MKKIVTFILTAALLAAPAAGFAYSDDIAENAKEYNILEGDESGDLKLDDHITRAEMTKILCTVMQLDTEYMYTDMRDIDGHWAAKYIFIAERNGIVNGFGDRTFRPDEYVTYEQAIKMILGQKAYGLSVYPDTYIGFAVDNNLLDNVDSLAGEYITRGDAAQIISNLIDALKADAIGYYSNYPGVAALSKLYQPKETQPKPNGSGGGSINRIPSTGGSSAAAATPIPGTVLPGSNGVFGGASASAPDTAYLYSIEESTYDYDSYINPYYSSEEYDSEDENIFKSTSVSPLSTFSIDTDTASYSNMRRFITNGRDFPDGAIRTEELINYFDYDLPQPTDGTPFSVTTETAQCPWNDAHLLTMINVQGEELTERQPQNLVFLLDVSGSMGDYNKLPLVKRSMQLLLSRLDERDTVSIVTYASGTEVVAEGIPASEKDSIMQIVNGLEAYGATYGEGGIELAYEQAEKFKCDGNNRIILCTDGDFNVGKSDDDSLKKLISEKRDNGIFLSVLGFGIGNYKDAKMEILADNGDGGYYYIDNLREAKKVLADEMTATLYTIAKDVKIQVEFNPTQVSEYRLIGYENRRLQNEQFADDRIDAGELGAGANVTAFYEIVPADGSAQAAEYKYQSAQYGDSTELMTVKLRYKLPTGSESILKEYPVENTVTEASENFCFAAAAAELGMLLNDSEYSGTSSYDSVIALARGAMGNDQYGSRHEFIQLVDLLRIMGSREG